MEARVRILNANRHRNTGHECVGESKHDGWYLMLSVAVESECKGSLWRFFGRFRTKSA